MEDVQNNYKVGYFAALFFRVHMKRHFIQPEIMYNVYKGEIAFNKNQNNENTLPEFAKLNSTIHSLELPILYGYSFVKSRPYGMALFIGPKLEYVWKHKTAEEFEGFGHSGIKEELRPINISSVIGLGVNIANIFFDFRYEIGLTNISKSIIYEKRHRWNNIPRKRYLHQSSSQCIKFLSRSYFLSSHSSSVRIPTSIIILHSEEFSTKE